MLAAQLPIALVVADRRCRGLELAADTVYSVLVQRADWSETFDRDAYAATLVETLGAHDIDTVAMAGFGTILGTPAFDAYPDSIINTHPALLPSFPGWHAVADALAYGVKVTGCTIHVATEVVDDGPILAQEAVAINADDDEVSLHERIKVVERRLYIETLRTIESRGRVI